MTTQTVEREQEQQAKAQPVGCPVCGAAMRPQRGTWRCGRCGLDLCFGCEPHQDHEEAA